MAAPATKKYEDFDPSTETVQEKDCDTILLYAPGFKKEKLRVQLTSTNVVRISGERETEDSKFIRFQKQFPITPNVDTNRITAKFENGILYVRLPKLITTITTEEKPADNKSPEAEAAHYKPQQTTQNFTSTRSDHEGSSKLQSQDHVPPPQKKTVMEKDERKAKNEVKSTTKTEDPVGSQLGRKLGDEKPENNNVATRPAGESGNKTGLKNQEGTAYAAFDVAAKRLMMSRRAIYVVLVGLAAVGVGLYVTNFIRSFRTTPEISG